MNRRSILSSALAVSGTALLPRRARATEAGMFPAGFHWGAATSAYQVEGGWNEDGKGESIWDRFVLAPGKIAGGGTGKVACDSYHKWEQDIALLRAMNLTSYRFSTAWTRIQPDGTGPANPKGLDYYSRLTDALLQAGIRPMPTLYHFDLPQDLEDRGGWANRDTAARFADFAGIMAKALGDRIENWSLFNEPQTFTVLGYLAGAFAPGRKDPQAFLRSTHSVNLAHGLGFRALKAINPKLKVGSVYDVAPIIPASSSARDKAAADIVDTFRNLWFVQTVLTGRYPDGPLPAARQAELLGLQAGDEAVMKADLDFVGLNYYSGAGAAYSDNKTGIPALDVSTEWAIGSDDKTDFGWAVYPQGFRDILNRMHKVTGDRPIEIMENGCAYNVGPGPDGQIHDPRRIAFYRANLISLAQAIADGVPVRGFHAWSLMDNFEWSSGYTMRFGLTHVDFDNGQKRTIKDAGHWYAGVARANRVV